MSSTTFSDDMNHNDYQPPKIFLLNGPAGSGKDTAGAYLVKSVGGRVLKFAEPIKRAAAAIYHAGDRNAFNVFDASVEEKKKPRDIYFGKSCREVQIGVSENFLKPFHGDQQIFGRILCEEIDSVSQLNEGEAFFITDSGFRPEAEMLVERYGAENVFLFRLFRDGCSFAGDSRSYITLKDLGVSEFDIQNPNDNIGAFYKTLYDIGCHCVARRV